MLDDVVHIGSSNFDIRSLYLNLEMMLRVDDPGFADDDAQLFRAGAGGEPARSRPSCTASGRRCCNRLIWALSFFLVTSADYTLTRRLNFGTALGESSSRLAPGPEQGRGRHVDPFEAAVDPLEMRGDEVAHLGAELIDQERAAGADRRGRSPRRSSSPTPGGRVEKGRPDRT